MYERREKKTKKRIRGEPKREAKVGSPSNTYFIEQSPQSLIYSLFSSRGLFMILSTSCSSSGSGFSVERTPRQSHFTLAHSLTLDSGDRGGRSKVSPVVLGLHFFLKFSISSTRLSYLRRCLFSFHPRLSFLARPLCYCRSLFRACVMRLRKFYAVTFSPPHCFRRCAQRPRMPRNIPVQYTGPSGSYRVLLKDTNKMVG